MPFNKNTIQALSQQAWRHVSGNPGLTNEQMAFAIAEHVADDIAAISSAVTGHYAKDTDSYHIICHPADTELRSIRVILTNHTVRQGIVSWPSVSADVQYLDQVDVKPHYDALKDAMVADFDYAWGWHCNLAMPIVDTIGVSHQDANRVAAVLMRHMFDIDVTQSDRYTDIFKQQEPTPVDNTLHVTITGFGENTGAEKLATHIYGWCHASGYKNTGISLANTTLATGQRSEKMPPTDTVIHITGVESRYHTDMAGPDLDQETAVDQADDGQEVAVEYGTASDDECTAVYDAADKDPLDGSCEVGGIPGSCFCGGFTPGKLTLNLELHASDSSPLLTIAYFQNAHPTADINVACSVDYDLTTHIHSLHNDAPVIEEPEVTEPTGLVAIDKPAPKLANPHDLDNAYVLGMEVEGKLAIAVMHLNSESDKFDVEQLTASGIKAVPVDDIQKLLEEQAPAALPYLSQLQVNNLRWHRLFGDVDKLPVPPVEETFSIYSIEQGAIPPSLYDTVEECWTCWQRSVDLPRLGDEIGDPSVVIDLTGYNRVVKFGSVFLEHPRLEELFLTLLRKRAETNVQLATWLRAMRRL